MYVGKICVATTYFDYCLIAYDMFDTLTMYEFHAAHYTRIIWFKQYVCLDCEYNRQHVWIYQIVDSIVNNPVDNPFSTLSETVVMRWTPIIEDMKWVKSWPSFKPDRTWDFILQFGGLGLFIIGDLFINGKWK